MSRLIDRAELFNRLASIKAPPEANEYKAEVYSLIQSMDAPVHCCECKYWYPDLTTEEWVGKCFRDKSMPIGSEAEGYCGWAERRES